MHRRPSTPNSQHSGASQRGFRDSIKEGIRKGKEKLERGSMRGAASSVVVALGPVAELAADISDNVGIPGLKFGIKFISEVLKRAEQMSETKEDVETLKGRIMLLKTLLERLKDPNRGSSLSLLMRQRFERFAESWREIETEASTLVSHGRLKRFFHSQTDRAKLARLVQKMDGSVQEFLVEGTLSIEATVYDIHRIVTNRQDESYMPRHARGARYYDNDARQQCLPGTRVETLGSVCEWILAKRKEHVLWLNGVAGVGKTTIAYSIAKWCENLGVLSASFFCSRSDEECSDIGLIFNTLSYQLCAFDPAFRRCVIETIRADSGVLRASLTRQVKELLVRPLQETKGSLKHTVIILDALDECKDDSAVSTVLTALSQFISDDNWPKIIITSRPEPHISAAFGRQEFVQTAAPHLVLHDLPLPTVQEDIKRFMQNGLVDVRNVFRLSPEWPSKEEVDGLSAVADGLFVVASTALKFVGDRKACQPIERVQLLLSTEASLHGIVDHLYQEIAEESCTGMDDESQRRLQTIFGALAVLQQPLPPARLATFVNRSEDSVRAALSGLHSVLLVPDGNSQPIRFFHPTFHEFLLKSQASKPIAFTIDPPVHHLDMLSRSLDVMQKLERNIIRIEDPTTLLDEISELSDKVRNSISMELSYACRYWGTHLRRAFDGHHSMSSIFELLCAFVDHRLLNWLEACVLLRAFQDAVTTLDSAWRTCQVLEGLPPETATILSDCRRLTLAFMDCIQVAPLQVYHSVLALAPQSSLLARTYADQLGSAMVIEQGARKDWGPRLATFVGHGGKRICSVAFSPCGNRFATGVGDGTIKVWGTLTCGLLLSIEGHEEEVNTLAYSPAGDFIASGSDDTTIQVWDASSGYHIRTLSGHTSKLCSVVYSADGRYILSSTFQGQMKLWDASKGKCLLTLDADQTAYQVGIWSNAGTAVIAFCIKASLCLYRFPSGARETLDLPGEGPGIAAFSRDGVYVAATNETILHVWKLPEKSVVRSIVVPQVIHQLAFSNDSAQICCGCNDGAVRIWTVRSQDSPCIMTGHTNSVWGVSWSPDDSQVVSAGADGTISLWDTASRYLQEPDLPPNVENARRGSARLAVVCNKKIRAATLLDLPPSEAHDIPNIQPFENSLRSLTQCADDTSAWNIALDTIFDGDDPSTELRHASAWAFCSGQRSIGSDAVAFSDDMSLMACTPTASPTTVEIYNLHTGSVVATLAGHEDKVLALTFSPDRSRLATGSRDRTVKVWHIPSATLIGEHDAHTDWVRAVAFSSDGSRVASGSDDLTARVFEVDTGRLVQQFEPHYNFVMKTLFTVDDRHVVSQDDSGDLYFWDAAEGYCIQHLSLRNPPGVPWFSPFTLSSIALIDDVAGEKHRVALWKPGSRSWPCYSVEEDGWVYAKSPSISRRLSWLPSEWRACLPSTGRYLHVVDCAKKRVLVVNMSRLL